MIFSRVGITLVSQTSKQFYFIGTDLNHNYKVTDIYQHINKVHLVWNQIHQVTIIL